MLEPVTFEDAMLSDEQKIYRTLRDGFYHSTSRESMDGILKDKIIRPSDKSMRSKFPGSYAMQHGYVALFDFVDVEESTFVESFWKCDKFFIGINEARFLIGFDFNRLRENLIRYDPVKEGIVSPSQRIPYLEVWYPYPIPVEWATNVFIIPPAKPVEIFRWSDNA